MRKIYLAYLCLACPFLWVLRLKIDVDKVFSVWHNTLLLMLIEVLIHIIKHCNVDVVSWLSWYVVNFIGWLLLCFRLWYLSGFSTFWSLLLWEIFAALLLPIVSVFFRRLGYELFLSANHRWIGVILFLFLWLSNFVRWGDPIIVFIHQIGISINLNWQSCLLGLCCCSFRVKASFFRSWLEEHFLAQHRLFLGEKDRKALLWLAR